jgi:hypothetical protein
MAFDAHLIGDFLSRVETRPDFVPRRSRRVIEEAA